MSEQPERPRPDADASEIMQWMEADFETSVSDGLIEALERKDDERKD